MLYYVHREFQLYIRLLAKDPILSPHFQPLTFEISEVNQVLHLPAGILPATPVKFHLSSLITAIILYSRTIIFKNAGVSPPSVSKIFSKISPLLFPLVLTEPSAACQTSIQVEKETILSKH